MYVWWSLLTLVKLAGWVWCSGTRIFVCARSSILRIQVSMYIYVFNIIHCIHVHVAIWVSNNTNILSFSLSLSPPLSHTINKTRILSPFTL